MLLHYDVAILVIERNENIYSQKFLYKNVHSSLLHNSPKLEILNNHKKKITITISISLDEEIKAQG